MKNSADLGGCYPPRLSASVDNTLLDLQNSSYPNQPYSIIAEYCESTSVKIVEIAETLSSKFTDLLNTLYIGRLHDKDFCVLNFSLV